MKIALITGITGQDGSYLAEWLLKQNYRVIGLVRQTSTINDQRIAPIRDRIELAHGDLLDQGSLSEIFETYRPMKFTTWVGNPMFNSHGHKPCLQLNPRHWG